ncbi:MAG: ethanolamine utilization protein EutD [Nitrospirales bacterium]|nr:MAG: ethanolamine utilization protein EutD [Nitrospirales bacterium]
MLIILGILSGIFLGGLIPEAGRAVSFLGELFLRALFVMVVPLVMSSMIVGVSSLGDVRQLGQLGGRTILFFMTTTGIAVAIGLILVLAIHPGVPLENQALEPSNESAQEVSQRMEDKPTTLGALLKTILTSMVPHNLFAAMANTEVLPLIVFSLMFGGILTTIGEKGTIVIRLFEGINEAIMGIVHLLMWVAPIGIGALIAGRLGEAGGFAGFWPQLQSLGAYAGTVILALLLHGLIVLPIVLRFLGKQSIPAFAKVMSAPLMTAFSTSSSSATMPLTIDSLIEKGHISRRTVSFVIPLGATINMNGTALYEAVAAVFIAQSYGIELGLGETIIVLLTATLSAIGAAGIPEAGLVTMVIVLKAVDLPIEGVSLILVIDWFLDRCRTTVNVWSDAVGAAVIDRLEGGRENP